LTVTNCFGQVQIILVRFKLDFYGAGTKIFEEALNAVKCLGWLKKFGPTQNIFGPLFMDKA
jgi:hypothetical protein